MMLLRLSRLEDVFQRVFAVRPIAFPALYTYLIDVLEPRVMAAAARQPTQPRAMASQTSPAELASASCANPASSKSASRPANATENCTAEASQTLPRK